MLQMMGRIDRVLYPDFGKNWDDRLFRARVLDRLGDGKDKDILDLGAGAGILEHMNFRWVGGRRTGNRWMRGTDYSPARSRIILSKSGLRRKLRLTSLSITGFKAGMKPLSLARSSTPAVPVSRNPCMCAMALANLSSRISRAEG